MNPSLSHRLAEDLEGTYAEVIRQHQDGLYSGIRRLAPSPADAEDLTQETFVKAYRALSKYEPEQVRELRLRPWLWTIALNSCRNAARTRSRRALTVPIETAPEAPGPDDVERDAMDLAFEAEWQRRLGRLRPRHRTAVVLRHVADLSYAEIAATLNRPEATVRSDVLRGLQQLRGILAEEEPERRIQQPANQDGTTP